MMGGRVIYCKSIRFNPNRWDFLNFDTHLYNIFSCVPQSQHLDSMGPDVFE